MNHKPMTDNAPYLVVENVTKRFGGLLALDKVSIQARRGWITGIIGSNGAGKTTLLNVISQFIAPDEGRIYVGDRELTGLLPHNVVGLGVARTFQQLRIFENLTVRENVNLGFQDNLGEALWRLALNPRSVSLNRGRNDARAEAILRQVQILELADEQAQNLSYGQKKLLSLARVLATDAEVIMLDEPTSGLSAEFIGTILEICRNIISSGKTILLIEHDMDVIFEICDWIIVLDQGRLLFEGTPEQVRANADVKAVYLG